MIEKVKRENNTLTLPDSIVSMLGDTEYFTAVASSDRIVLTPIRAKKNGGFASLCGKGKGKVWMADDFDETPEEFAEYM